MGLCDRANNLISFQFPWLRRERGRNAAIFDYFFPQRKTINVEKLERNRYLQ